MSIAAARSDESDAGMTDRQGLQAEGDLPSVSDSRLEEDKHDY